MAFFDYILLSLVSSFSIFVGAFIAGNSEEELKQGAKYIRILMISLSYLAILFTGYLLSASLFLMATLPTLIIFIIFFLPGKFRYYFTFSILAIVLSVNLRSGINYILPSLIFVLGLCIGSLVYYTHEKVYLKLSMLFSLFNVIVILILLF